MHPAVAGASGWPRRWVQQEPLLERQHDRLEGRWLEAAGALCPGHRSGHQEAARSALAQFCRGSGSRRARLAWLQELQGWFSAHRRGPDAMAYALARERSTAQVTAKG